MRPLCSSASLCEWSKLTFYSNMGEGSSRASTSESDRPVDEYPNESVVSHREGETGSGGRGR